MPKGSTFIVNNFHGVAFEAFLNISFGTEVGGQTLLPVIKNPAFFFV